MGIKTLPSPEDQCPVLLVTSDLKAVVLYVLSSFSHVKESKLGPATVHGYKQQIQQALKNLAIAKTLLLL